MDTYEATKIVMSRIQTLDPTNASKIMGYILIQDHGENEMIRLAFGPESSLISLINLAKTSLSLNNPFPTTSPRPISNEPGLATGSGHPFGLDPVHRRSCSVNDDASFLMNLDEGNGFGWKPCMYFAKGFCKNGSFCKFSHDFGDEMFGFDEVLRIKALQQRFGYGNNSYPFGYGKCGNFVNENLRNEFSHMGLGEYGSSTSRQIYLTFPADSTFKEEDVSGYFSMFGPVQDVRIPYQQKRMFGFVSFLYPETVKLILAKGNPHFVCDSRVLVKPYKEKGKFPERRFQHSDSGDYSACLSPESREPFDLPFESRMLFNAHAQEMMRRRKLEQDAELYAIELQERRMMNLQLNMDLKNQNFLPSSPPGVPVFSPRQSEFLMNQNVNREVSVVFDGRNEVAKSPGNATADTKVLTAVTDSSDKIIGSDDEKLLSGGGPVLPVSLEHTLPDNLFASPTKNSSAAEQHSTFSQAFSSDNGNMPVTNSSSNSKKSLLPDSSPLSMASLKPCYFQMPSH